VPVLQRVAAKLGWEAVDRAEAGAGLYWVCQKDKVVRLVRDLPSTQLIGRYPRMNVFCNKVPFAHIMQQAAAIFPNDFDFWARSYMLPGDELALKEAMHSCSKKQFWIVKPDGGSQGTGIFLTNAWEDLVAKVGGVPASGQWIAQHYMPDPYLLDGMKFDLRLYVLVSSAGGSYRAFLSKKGLVRLCTERYKKPTAASKDKVNCHLTNYSLNKHSDAFVRGGEDDATGGSGSKRSLDAVMDELRGRGEDVEGLWDALRKLAGNTVAALHGPVMEACEEAKSDGANLFQVMGFDVLLDSALKPLLLEVNNHPSMAIDTPVPLAEAELLLPQAHGSMDSLRWESGSDASSMTAVSRRGSGVSSTGLSTSSLTDSGSDDGVLTRRGSSGDGDFPDWAKEIFDGPSISDVHNSFGSPPLPSLRRPPPRSKSCPGRNVLMPGAGPRRRPSTPGSNYSQGEEETGDRFQEQREGERVGLAPALHRSLDAFARGGGLPNTSDEDSGLLRTAGSVKRTSLPPMDARPVPGPLLADNTALGASPKLTRARSQQQQRFVRLQALPGGGRSSAGGAQAGRLLGDHAGVAVMGVPAGQERSSAPLLQRSQSQVQGPKRASPTAMTTSARAVLMGSSNGGTPPLAESKANGARRPVESAGGARLPLPPSTPAQGAAPPPQSRTASGKSALKQRPVWGGNGASSSKRVMYEVPSGVKPKPMLRPATHHGSAAAGAGASAGKQSAAGSGGTSRRWRSNYIPDGECRCKDYHLPHKHIVSPVDEAVKLGTLLATLRIVRRMHKADGPIDEVTESVFDECHPSLEGDDSDPVEDDHGEHACCSSLLAKCRAIYLSITSVRTGDDGSRLRFVESGKFRRWAAASGIFAPEGSLKSVDFDIAVRQWRSATPGVQEAVGSSLLGFMEVMLVIAGKARPDLPLAEALSEVVSAEETPVVGREEWVK